MVVCSRLVVPTKWKLAAPADSCQEFGPKFQRRRENVLSLMEANISGLDRSPLPFLHLVQALKHLPRTGWLRTVENPESVASHSFRLALLGLFAPVGPALPTALYRLMCRQENLDRMKCMFIGVLFNLYWDTCVWSIRSTSPLCR